MRRLNNFIKKSIIGGLLVISPAIILFFAFRWAFQSISQLIQPLAEQVGHYSNAPEPLIDLSVIGLILIGCFIVGNIITTRAGKWLHTRFDQSLSRLAPGYNLIKGVIQQFFGDQNNSPFKSGEVAVARLFGPNIPTKATCIVTSHHQNGWLTVFIPTGPNPTSGLIYHLPPDQVELLPHIKIDEALRTIIACGAGSSELLNKEKT